MAAARLWPGTVIASDIDPVAVEALGISITVPRDWVVREDGIVYGHVAALIDTEEGFAEFSGRIVEATPPFTVGEGFLVSVKDSGKRGTRGDEIGMKYYDGLGKGCAKALDDTQFGRKGIITGGNIRVRSAPAEGTEVEVRLPRVTVAEPVEARRQQGAQEDGPAHAVQVDGPETHLLGFFHTMGDAPRPVRMPAKGQVLQVMLDIFS